MSRIPSRSTGDSNDNVGGRTREKKAKKKRGKLSPDCEESESEGDSKPKNLKAWARVKSLAAADGLGESPTICTMCKHRGHVCHVNPKATKKATAACFECNHWRLKCSLSPSRGKKGEALPEQNDEEIAASKEQSPTGKQRERKRLNRPEIPASSSGQPARANLNSMVRF